MRISSAAILAVCVAASNALPVDDPHSLIVPKPGNDAYIPGCTGVIFPAVYPPTAAELRCRELETKAKKDVEGEKPALPKVDESIPGCKDTVFLDIYPPSKAELRCRGLIDDKGNPIEPKKKNE